MTPRGRPGSSALLIGVPLGVLLAALLWLAWEHGTMALWRTVVHENGRHTLGQTILYFDHFLREVPVDIAMALFIVAALPQPDGRSKSRFGPGLVAWIFAILLVLIAWFVTARSQGGGSAARDLLQYRTRDAVEAYGSHWHFHWLSTLWMGVAAPVVARILDQLSGRSSAGASTRATWMAWGFFLAFTAVFGVTEATFTDPRYIGHQAREMFTHAPVTLLLALGLLQLTTNSPAPAPARLERPAGRVVNRIQLIVSLAIPAYLGWMMMTTDVMGSGQSEGGLSAMVGAHFFEHVLDYLLVALITLGVRPLVSRRTTLSYS